MKRRAFLGTLAALAIAPHKVFAGSGPVMGVDLAAPNTASFTVTGLVSGDRVTLYDPVKDEVLASEVAEPCSTSHTLRYVRDIPQPPSDVRKLYSLVAE